MHERVLLGALAGGLHLNPSGDALVQGEMWRQTVPVGLVQWEMSRQVSIAVDSWLYYIQQTQTAGAVLRVSMAWLVPLLISVKSVYA